MQRRASEAELGTSWWTRFDARTTRISCPTADDDEKKLFFDKIGWTGTFSGPWECRARGLSDVLVKPFIEGMEAVLFAWSNHKHIAWVLTRPVHMRIWCRCYSAPRSCIAYILGLHKWRGQASRESVLSMLIHLCQPGTSVPAEEESSDPQEDAVRVVSSGGGR